MNQYFVRCSKILVLYALCSIAGVVVAADEAPVDAGPRDVVVAATQHLLTVVKQQQAKIKQDQLLVQEIADRWIDPYLDYEYLARTVLGKHWRTATPAQQASFSEAFQGFVRRTYVAALRAYVEDILAYGETLRYPTTPYKEKDGFAEVRAEVKHANNPVPLDFRLRKEGATWKIFDVTVEGVSLALTYRKQFSGEIQQVGLDGLTKRISQHKVSAK